MKQPKITKPKVSSLRHVTRAFAMALGAFAVLSSFVSSTTLFFAVVGAGGGSLIGEFVSRGKRTARSLIFVALIVLLLGNASAHFVSDFRLFAYVFSPASALSFSAFLRFTSLSLAVPFISRVLAKRRQWAVALELGLMVLAIVSVFAAHRDGMVARPLWLSDWAWRHDVEPSQVLLAVGVISSAILALLLLVETGSRRFVSALFVLVAMGLAALLFLRASGKTDNQPVSDVPGISSNAINPPPPPPDDGGSGHNENEDGGGNSGSDGGGGGSSSADASTDGGGGGQGKDGGGGGGSPDGGKSDAGGSSGDGGSDDKSNDGGAADAGEPPPPPPAQWEENEQKDNKDKKKPPPLAVVIFEDDYSPPAQSFYFREEAWSDLRAARFYPSSRSDVDNDVRVPFPEGAPVSITPPPAKHRKHVNGTVSLMAQEPRPFALESVVEFAPNENPNPATFKRSYHFESMSIDVPFQEMTGQTSGDPTWPTDVRTHYLTVPQDARWTDLVKKETDKLSPAKRGDPFLLAGNLKLFLEKTLVHSSKAGRHKSADAISEMMFGDKTGTIIEITMASAIVLRAAEIPTRIGVGYGVDEDRRKGSTLIIQAGDGRVWPEIYLRDLGWVPLEIVPQKTLDDSKGDPPDEEQQKKLGEQARGKGKGKGRGRGGGGGGFGLDIFLWMALIAAILPLIIAYIVKFWRLMAPAFAASHELPRLGYRTMLDRLSAVRVARKPSETREEFAERIKEQFPSLSEMTPHHTAGLLRGPYVEEGRPEFQSSTWSDGIRKLKGEIRAHTPWMRRFLGILNPLSFLRSK